MPGVIIQITGDGETAKRALEMVQESLQTTREQAKVDAAEIAAAMARIQESMEKTAFAAAKDMSRVQVSMAKTGSVAKEEASAISEAMAEIKAAIATVAIYGAVIGAISEVKELTIGSFELGESLEKASQKTGLAVGTLSTLHYAAAVTGSDFDAMTSAVAKMDNTIAAATQKIPKAEAFMKSLGLDAKDLAGRTDGAEIAFKTFAQTLAATESPIRRNELAQGLLGKAGKELIPMLIEVGSNWDQFTQKAKAAGVYLDAQGAQSLAETNRRMREMQQEVTGAGLAFSEGLGPALSGIFETIGQGKSAMDTLTQWGHIVGRVMAGTLEVVYSLTAAMEKLFATAELGKFTEAGRKDLAAADDLIKQAQRFHDIAFGPDPVTKQVGSAPRKPGGFEGVGDFSKPKENKDKGDNNIAAAATALAQEQSKALADAQQQTTQAMLAELDAQHKLMLVSDSEFYQEKLRLQTEELEAEKASLEQQEKSLDALYARQRSDTKLKRDKSGNSAEELKTQREILEVQEKIGAVVARSQQAGSASNAEVSASNRAAELAGLRLAADLEKERNSGLEAQIALIRREKELESQKITNAGGTDSDAATIKALGQIAVQKLQIADLDHKIRDSEADNRRAVEELNDAASKDPRLKQAAAKAINQANAEEAAQLKVLVQQYDELAQLLGGEYLQKAKDLHAELDKLNRPDQKQDAQFTKTLVDGLEGLSKKMIDTSETGKQSFHNMAKSIEKDVLDLAIKLAEEKWLTPLLTSALGGGAGKPGALPQVGGAPALPQAAASASSGVLSKVLGGFGLGGGGKDSGKVTLNIINQTSAPITSEQTHTGGSSDLEDTIVHIVLKNASDGGPLYQLLGSGGGGDVDYG